jgi:reactive intermediate/imine deaminase
MEKKLISTGSAFEEKISYSRAVVAGNTIYVSGCTGYDYSTMTISPDIAQQTEQTLKNIIHALALADSKLSDVVKVTYIVTKGNEFEQCIPVLKEYFKDIRPAATMLVASLLNNDIKIEIEVIAVKE